MRIRRVNKVNRVKEVEGKARKRERIIKEKILAREKNRLKTVFCSGTLTGAFLHTSL